MFSIGIRLVHKNNLIYFKISHVLSNLEMGLQQKLIDSAKVHLTKVSTENLQMEITASKNSHVVLK